MSNTKAIIFDLDDTLLDSMALRVKSLNGVFRRAGLVGISAEYFLKGLRGGQLIDALESLERKIGIDDDLFEDYRQAYWISEDHEISLYPGVLELLQQLEKADMRMGLVTQKMRRFELDGHMAGASMEMEQVGISHFFSTVVGYEDVSNWKPHPEGVHLVMERLRVKPEETLVVGDSLADMKAARAATCRCCLATWGTYMDPDSIEADEKIGEPREVLGLVLK